MRGANIYQRRVYPELDGSEFLGPGPVGPPYVQEDFNQLAAAGSNYVNISHPGLYSETPPFAVDQNMQPNLDSLLAMIAQADMFAVISFRTGPGRAEFSVCCLGDDWFPESYLNDEVWEEQAVQDAWVEMWRYTAERYRENPIVVGYELMVEPNANEVLTGDWLDPDEFYAQYEDTLADWNQLYPRIAAAIREVDTQTPILVGGMGYSGVEWLPYLEPIGDPHTVYIVHQYAPHLYTHQWWDSLVCSYPGYCDLDWDGAYDDWLDGAWLDTLLTTVDGFAETHGVPVAVNEFGVVRWVPGAAEFMDDQMDLFERRSMNHALWMWDPAWQSWATEEDAFNFRHGPDPHNHTEVETSELSQAILRHWGRNTVRPSNAISETVYLPLVATPSQGQTPPLALGQVRHWAYQLQDISHPGAVDALAESRYDMLVLEPTRTDWSSDDRYFDTRGMVSRLQATLAGDGEHRKLVLAYIDIGEAEDWRWYWTWSTGWDCRGPRPADWPDYILTCDPDGWEGNYPIAYWDPAWKDVIIYGEHQGVHPDRDYSSAIDEAIRDGFDGIYLDWVEAFENEQVIAAAQAMGKDPAVEMITFIEEMRAYAQARVPGFLIIQQNALSLIDGHPQLLDAIDAIAQEAIWYDGSATDDWHDPEGYDWENEPDLTEYYLGYLGIYLNAGLPVFNCEYALHYAETAYANSYAQGFVPYVTRCSLSQLTTTPPPDY
jgi:cysteinyl-tRNA synthetase